ncbi:MAG: hypothetical protein K0S97_335 [Chloroflexota bacterium]|jgi:hypothetical protein|nr:hypothetical protein [Chloroflexota bacterium]
MPPAVVGKLVGLEGSGRGRYFQTNTATIASSAPASAP